MPPTWLRSQKRLPAEMAAQVAAQFAVNIALREMYEVNARTAESNNAAILTAAEKLTLATVRLRRRLSLRLKYT